MEICKPGPEHIHPLRELWKLVFGDGDDFLDLFFDIAFSPEQCLCIMDGDTAAGALYWLPCDSYAYIYAVATHPDHRGKGICRALMEKAHEEIRAQGYAGAVLYPQEAGLRTMYRRMGYDHETNIRELRCAAGGSAAALEKITAEAYFAERSALLPPDAIRQGSPFPEIMESFSFYHGEDILLAATVQQDTLMAAEYLGPDNQIPGILTALGCEKGIFRCPGEEIPFAMILPLTEEAQLPRYFAFPLD